MHIGYGSVTEPERQGDQVHPNKTTDYRKSSKHEKQELIKNVQNIHQEAWSPTNAQVGNTAAQTHASGTHIKQSLNTGQN